MLTRFDYEAYVLGRSKVWLNPDLGTGYQCLNLIDEYGWQGYLSKPGIRPADSSDDFRSDDNYFGN